MDRPCSSDDCADGTEEFDPLGQRVRCGSCGKLLAERIAPPWIIKCSRCKATNVARIHVQTFVIEEPSAAPSSS